MVGDDIVHPTDKGDISPQQGFCYLLDNPKPLVLGTPESEVSDISVVGDITEASLGEEVEVSLANGEIDEKYILEKFEGSDSAGNTYVKHGCRIKKSDLISYTNPHLFNSLVCPHQHLNPTLNNRVGL
jgi:hypothetical protein